MVANNGRNLDTLANHSSLSSRKYAAVLSVVIIEFENKFQDSKKVIIFLSIFVIPFSASINIPPADFQMECIDIQFKNLNMSVYWTFLSAKKELINILHLIVTFYSQSLLGSVYICEQLCSRMKEK